MDTINTIQNTTSFPTVLAELVLDYSKFHGVIKRITTFEDKESRYSFCVKPITLTNGNIVRVIRDKKYDYIQINGRPKFNIYTYGRTPLRNGNFAVAHDNGVVRVYSGTKVTNIIKLKINNKLTPDPDNIRNILEMAPGRLVILSKNDLFVWDYRYYNVINKINITPRTVGNSYRSIAMVDNKLAVLNNSGRLIILQNHNVVNMIRICNIINLCIGSYSKYANVEIYGIDNSYLIYECDRVPQFAIV